MMRKFLIRPFLTLLGVLMFSIGATWFAYDWPLVEKLFTRLAGPLGLGWLSLALAWLVSRECGQQILPWLLFSALFFFTVAGSERLGSWLMTQLEEPYSAIDPRNQQPFDSIVVLGGGVVPDRAVLGQQGDRVMMGARMFHLGLTKRLITTGRTHPWKGCSVSLADATALIWQDLRIPDRSIVRLGGSNTSQEMQALRGFFEDQPAKRVGLITSAWHMDRSLRLARKNGLALLPLPTDFESDRIFPLPLGVIPTDDGFRKTSRFFKEQLAQLVGR